MIKQGIVSHGYQLNGEVDLWRDWKAKGLDKAFSRGELAVEPSPRNGTYGNWASSPAWSPSKQGVHHTQTVEWTSA